LEFLASHLFPRHDSPSRPALLIRTAACTCIPTLPEPLTKLSPWTGGKLQDAEFLLLAARVGAIACLTAVIATACAASDAVGRPEFCCTYKPLHVRGQGVTESKSGWRSAAVSSPMTQEFHSGHSNWQQATISLRMAYSRTRSESVPLTTHEYTWSMGADLHPLGARKPFLFLSPARQLF
jgi:hypothetical protein